MPATARPLVTLPVTPEKRGPSGSELAGMGVFLAAAFLVPFFAGLFLDSLIHTSPIFLFMGLFIGIGAAAAGLYGRLKRYL